MAINAIVCPACGARIKFNEGDIVTHCVVCQTKFVTPDAVKVSAKPEATIVQVEPVVIRGGVN